MGSGDDHTWSQTDLYVAMNEDGFLTSLSLDWQRKIIEYTWPDNKEAQKYSTAEELCVQVQQESSVLARVGLITLSDYYYASNVEIGWCDQKYDCSGTWIKMENCGGGSLSSEEWTMTHGVYYDEYGMQVYVITNILPLGAVIESFPYDEHLVRPVFFLDMASEMTSSSGTLADPYIVLK